jgi:hypothetical protein
MALRWLDWRLARLVRDSLGLGEGNSATGSGQKPKNGRNIHLCFQQMSQIRELRRVLNGGINAELGLAGLLMDWYGGFGRG